MEDNGLKNLDEKRKQLELEAEAIASELNTPPSENATPVGISGSLVDREGYPRSDVDLYRVRSLRQRFSSIQTSHKNLMTKIEAALQLRAPQSQDKRPPDETAHDTVTKPWFDKAEGKWMTSPPERSMQDVSEEATKGDGVSKPIGFIHGLLDGSPAAEAGINEGDLVYKVDVINEHTPSPLQAIAAMVLRTSTTSSPMTVSVKPLNENRIKVLTVFPRKWDGKGYLGCQIREMP